MSIAGVSCRLMCARTAPWNRCRTASQWSAAKDSLGTPAKVATISSLPRPRPRRLSSVLPKTIGQEQCNQLDHLATRCV
eukprot:3776445-Pyramimonas_sp.AAC.1